MWRSKHPEPLPNTTFNEWTVIEDYRVEDKQVKDMLRVRCSCGVERDVLILNLINGYSKSCGHARYAKMAEMSRKGSHRYENRIGERFGNATLTAYTREPSGKHTFVLTCENGHTTTFNNRHATPKAITTNGWVCWCQKNVGPLQRLRLRKDATLQDASPRLNVSRQCVKSYENRCTKYSRQITRARRKMDQRVCAPLETKLKESYAFAQLCKGYALSTDEQEELFTELSQQSH